ncbi:hypothetical protein EAH72_15020 [Pseudomonas caspiana]|uniref:Uncharacterized protein n=1 Tax=Pseudomonas mandelii TaxID=75612 RepID=A0A502I4N3_9PSED|nr:hypothetical protein EAH74_22250 [Pseudomonas mandelii]TPG95382.1 hypothetical protein EAH72_15020 [Pseudomonas caspiana]
MGASLLAKGPSAPTLLLPDTPLSRAGSLPQFLLSKRTSETKTERSHAPFFVQVEITCRLAFP